MSGLAASGAATFLGPVLRDGIKRLSLREQIASSLADLIAAGLLHTGDELPAERDLAAMLEVSRDSVRGALQLLAERGILEIGHGTRTRVRAGPMTVDESQRFDLRRLPGLTDDAVIEARRLLEPELAGRAAQLIETSVLERLGKMLEAQADMIDDPVRFQISDREFHLAIFEAAGNPVLISFASQAYAHAYAHRRELMRHHDGIPLAIADHRRILAALVARDLLAAADAMRSHIETIAGLLAGVGDVSEGRS
ncbi:MAG: FadR/GntR family transcriptional regulator [Geminicoccaceae bacterium]